MCIHKYIIRLTDSLLNMIFIITILIVGLYCGYSLWDNQQVYIEAGNVQEDMLKIKPIITEGENGASFDELLAINKDVCAWLTLDNTKIDYPVLQGGDNLEYINKDVYGEFALAGSIYLDSRNSKDFTDAYSLIYGHHMANSKMFGDLDLYKEADFFEKNKNGLLLLPDRAYNLKIFACLVIDSNDDVIFNPEQWKKSASRVITYVEQNALHIHEELLNRIKGQDDVQILSLSTCSSEYDDARTIVLAIMEPYISSK